MSRRFWTDDELAILRARYPHERGEVVAKAVGRTLAQTYSKANALGIGKTPEFLASEAACRLRRGDNIGAAYRFKKGQVPPNKGMRGFHAPGSEKGWFGKGSKPHNWVPVGSHRLSKEGYLCRKMTDTGYPPRDWVAVHRLVWIEHHGEIPPGHHIRFKDGNKTNVVIENLECITRAAMMLRNTIHNLPAPLKEVIALKGAINRRITNHERKQQRA